LISIRQLRTINISFNHRGQYRGNVDVALHRDNDAERLARIDQMIEEARLRHHERTPGAKSQKIAVEPLKAKTAKTSSRRKKAS
jgi:hypothetical protein